MNNTKKGYDDTRSVNWVKPGAFFRVDGNDSVVFQRLGVGYESLPVGFLEPAHVTKPWTLVPCILVRDESGEPRFHLALLPVRTNVTVTEPNCTQCGEPLGSACGCGPDGKGEMRS